MLSKDEFVRRVLDDQRRRRQLKAEIDAKNRGDWWAFQSDKGVRLRAGAWRGAGRGVAR